MNWVDLTVLAVVFVSGLVGVLRGLVREVLGITAWIAAAWIASTHGLFPYVAPWARTQVTDAGVADIAAFGGIFVIALIVLWFVVGSISSRVRDSSLGGLDRAFGMVFGMARGAVLVALTYILTQLLFPPEGWPAPVKEARFLPLVHQGAEWLAVQLPPDTGPASAPPRPGARRPLSICSVPRQPGGRCCPGPHAIKGIPMVPSDSASDFVLDDDKLHEECGVFGVWGVTDAAAVTALGLHALQHRGQEATGIVSYDGARFHSHRGLGLVGTTLARPR